MKCILPLFGDIFFNICFEKGTDVGLCCLPTSKLHISRPRDQFSLLVSMSVCFCMFVCLSLLNYWLSMPKLLKFQNFVIKLVLSAIFLVVYWWPRHTMVSYLMPLLWIGKQSNRQRTITSWRLCRWWQSRLSKLQITQAWSWHGTSSA